MAERATKMNSVECVMYKYKNLPNIYINFFNIPVYGITNFISRVLARSTQCIPPRSSTPEHETVTHPNIQAG
jgi:hypothetical protein